MGTARESVAIVRQASSEPTFLFSFSVCKPRLGPSAHSQLCLFAPQTHFCILQTGGHKTQVKKYIFLSDWKRIRTAQLILPSLTLGNFFFHTKRRITFYNITSNTHILLGYYPQTAVLGLINK